MKSKLFTFVSTAILALFLFAGISVAQDIQQAASSAVGAAVQAYQAEFQKARDAGAWPDAEARGKMIDQALADIDPTTLSVEEMATICNAMPLAYSAKAPAFDAALAKYATEPTAEGARAAGMQFGLLGPETTQALRAEKIRELFKHPGIAQAWQQGKAMDMFGSFFWLDAEQLNSLQADYIALEPMISDQMPPAFFSRMAGAFFALADAGDTASAEAREPMRKHLVETIEKKLTSAELPEDQSKQLATARDRLNGAYARGMLVGHPAPELHFSWWANPNDANETYAKLSDLKGKVVVLDFWATWCGPCIGSFPNVKQLQAHYDGYDVVIVGVTSLQGAHYSGDERGKIDCTDDPAKEMGLMPEFMAAKDVTWRIAFAEEPVFNPDYGVNGIPHVAIIDPQGVVRFRGLHPATPMADKTSKIDALLAEAGKPVPAPPAEAEPAESEAAAQGGE